MSQLTLCTKLAILDAPNTNSRSFHWSQAMLGLVSTWMGDRLGTPDAVGIFFCAFFSVAKLPICTKSLFGKFFLLGQAIWAWLVLQGVKILKVTLFYLSQLTLCTKLAILDAPNTNSRLFTEVKQCWAWLVLGWVTAWEHRMLLASFFWVLICVPAYLQAYFENFHFTICTFYSSKKWYVWANFSLLFGIRPYHVENTSSRPITEVKQRWVLVSTWMGDRLGTPGCCWHPFFVPFFSVASLVCRLFWKFSFFFYFFQGVKVVLSV